MDKPEDKPEDCTTQGCKSCESNARDNVEIRKLLVLSTCVLPQEQLDAKRDAVADGWDSDNTRWPTAYGELIWVPDDPQESYDAQEEEQRESAEVLAIRLYARSLGCDYVLLDCDGELPDGCPLRNYQRLRQ